jgi:acyl carrier protein
MSRLEEMLEEILMCDVGSLPPSTPLREVEGFDSLRHVRLVVSLEAEFAVSLSEEDIRSIVTVGDVGRVLRDKGVDA